MLSNSSSSCVCYFKFLISKSIPSVWNLMPVPDYRQHMIFYITWCVFNEFPLMNSHELLSLEDVWLHWKKPGLLDISTMILRLDWRNQQSLQQFSIDLNTTSKQVYRCLQNDGCK